MKRILVINPHADDAEFTCATTLKRAIDLGWPVTQVLMTSDEYGTTRDDFKGKRMKRIRVHEMEEAARTYGTDADGNTKMKLIWFGEIDGHLPFNHDVFTRLRNIVLDFQPDIIFGPDSFFSMDLHPDHERTGWLVYLVVKSLEPSQRPLTLLYHSFNTDFFISMKRTSFNITALAAHKSQFPPLWLKILAGLRVFYYALRWRKTAGRNAEGFRRLTFKLGENKIEKLHHRILWSLFAKDPMGHDSARFKPTPEELGLV